LFRNVSYFTTPVRALALIASGSCAARANDSERKTMNSVHFTIDQVGVNPACTAFSARNANMIGKKKKYAYDSPTRNSPVMTVAKPIFFQSGTRLSGQIPRSFSESRL